MVKEPAAGAPSAGDDTLHVTLPLGFKLEDELVKSRRAASAREAAAAAPRAARPTLDGVGREQVSRVRATLFREQAQRAKSQELKVPALPEVTTPRWVVLGLLGSAIGCLILVGLLGRVEVTSTALGALVVREGPRPVVMEVGGKLVALSVEPGRRVAAGQPIARVHATELRAREQKDAVGLARIREDVAQRLALASALERDAVGALTRKRKVLVQRSELKVKMTKEREQRARQMEELTRQGVASEADAVQAREAASAQREERLALQQQIAEVELEIGDRRKRQDEEERALAEELKRAEATLGETRTLLEATEVLAPVAGTVESLLFVEGQVGEAGDVVARIVPEGSLTRAIVFAPAKDAAFLREGLAAKVEFASLPVAEFGRVKATVVRVSSDVATAAELSEVGGLAATGPLIRVELELVPGVELARASSRLRSGERVVARLTTRERRVFTLLFDFLLKWYPS